MEKNRTKIKKQIALQIGQGIVELVTNAGFEVDLCIDNKYHLLVRRLYELQAMGILNDKFEVVEKGKNLTGFLSNKGLFLVDVGDGLGASDSIKVLGIVLELMERNPKTLKLWKFGVEFEEAEDIPRWRCKVTIDPVSYKEIKSFYTKLWKKLEVPKSVGLEKLEKFKLFSDVFPEINKKVLDIINFANKALKDFPPEDHKLILWNKGE